MFLRTNAKFEPGEVKRNFFKVDFNGFHDLHDISTSGYNEGEITSTVEWEYSKTKTKSSEIDNKTQT